MLKLFEDLIYVRNSSGSLLFFRIPQFKSSRVYSLLASRKGWLSWKSTLDRSIFSPPMRPAKFQAKKSTPHGHNHVAVALYFSLHNFPAAPQNFHQPIQPYLTAKDRTISLFSNTVHGLLLAQFITETQIEFSLTSNKHLQTSSSAYNNNSQTIHC